MCILFETRSLTIVSNSLKFNSVADWIDEYIEYVVYTPFPYPC